MFTESIKPFIVMDVLERAIELEREGRSIIHLEIGEPDFPTPERIVASANQALREKDTHYTDSRGTLELRQAISAYYMKNYGVNVDTNNILITMGTSPAMYVILSTLISEPDDEVIIANPCYPCYPNFIRLAGGKPVMVETTPEEGFQLTAEKIVSAITKKTRAVIINSPSNPAGTIIEEEELKKIASIGIPIISDEIYHGLVYGERAHSILEYTNNAFVLNGFSKLFAMTGWRLGYAIVPNSSVRPIHILLQNLFISPNSFVQRAGITALTEKIPEIDEMIKIYNSRREFIMNRLTELGIKIPVEPRGAFYFFINMAHVDKNSYRLAFDLLEQIGLALTPGIDFGSRGEGYMRLSYANSIENISEGLRRLEVYIDRNK